MKRRKKKASTCKLPIHTLSSSDWTKKCIVSRKGSKKTSLVLMKIFEEFGQRMQRASEINSAWWRCWWACTLFFISSQWLIKHQLQEAESDGWDCDLTLERPCCCAYHRQHASLLSLIQRAKEAKSHQPTFPTCATFSLYAFSGKEYPPIGGWHICCTVGWQVPNTENQLENERCAVLAAHWWQ